MPQVFVALWLHGHMLGTPADQLKDEASVLLCYQNGGFTIDCLSTVTV